MEKFNTNSFYFKNSDIIGHYEMIGMYYNEKNKLKGSSVYPYSFEDLVELFIDNNIYSEVYLMGTSIECYKLKKNINELIQCVDLSIALGKLKSNISIPLSGNNLGKNTCFLMIVASNGTIGIGHPFTLRFMKEAHSKEDHKLKLKENLPYYKSINYEIMKMMLGIPLPF